MQDLKTIRKRVREVGLGAEEKHQFVLGPQGLPITLSEKLELEEIGVAAAQFIGHVDRWYKEQKDLPGGSWWLRLMGKGVPADYLHAPWVSELPFTMMVDTVFTSQGWRIVEIDATNRNAMGYPLVMRYLYDLPLLWQGLAETWRAGGWAGCTQIMGDLQRYYEPYFRFFLKAIDGDLVREAELRRWLGGFGDNTKLLDIPVMYFSNDSLERILQRLGKFPIAIPPKHPLSSKATLSLLWEEEGFVDEPVKKFAPVTRLLSSGRPLPSGSFLVKMLQSSGAHGVFLNDSGLLAKLHSERKPQAIWQEQLPITTKRVRFLDDDGNLNEGDFYVRVSLFITSDGKVVDADATCSPSAIVHGSRQSVMTVPVLI